MSSFLKNSLLLVTFIVGCSDHGTNSDIPKPGLKQKPQIQVIADVASPLEQYAGFPSEVALGAQLEARVVWARVKTPTEAEENLRSANGKPLDLLILGPGLPADTWSRLKLPKDGRRLTLIVGTSASVGAITAMVNERDVLSARASFCEAIPKQQGCGKAALNVFPRWKEFLEDLLKSNDRESNKTPSLNFFSGYLTITAGPEFKMPDKQKLFDNWKRDFMMKALSEHP